MAGYWIKLYHEILDDPKMATLPDRLWRRFYELCLIAGRADQEGKLPEIKQIAWTLRMSPDEIKPDIDELQKLGLISIENENLNVTNFSKRQSAPTSAEKIKFHRDEKRRNQYYQDDVTISDTTVTNTCNQSLHNRNINVKQKERKIEDTDTDKKDKKDTADPKNNWNHALGELYSTMSRVDFDTWIKPLTFCGVRNGTYVIHAANRVGKEWVVSRCKSTLERQLMSPVEITTG